MNIISGLCFYTAYHLTLFEVGDENKKIKKKNKGNHVPQNARLPKAGPLFWFRNKYYYRSQDREPVYFPYIK